MNNHEDGGYSVYSAGDGGGGGGGGGGAGRGNRSSFSQAPNLTRICKSSLMLDCCTQGMSTLAACGTERGVVKG